MSKKSSRKKPTLQERVKNLATTDNIIDFSVDVFLIVYDVLSSPILIVVRVLRWMFKKAFATRIKRFVKWFVHKVLKVK
mgnify:FL=1